MKMQIISFHCVLKNKLGQVISSTYNRDILTGNGSESQELAALGSALQNLTTGEKRLVNLKASEAYGFYDPKMVVTMPRERLPQVKPAKFFSEPVFLEVDGRKKSFRVLDVTTDEIVLDGNHPLAGQDLVFEIETLTVRDATPEEITGANSEPAQPQLH